MDSRTRRYAMLALGVVLIVVGTLSTGLLPSGLPYQVLAGGIIVAGFAVVYAGLGALELPES